MSLDAPPSPQRSLIFREGLRVTSYRPRVPCLLSARKKNAPTLARGFRSAGTRGVRGERGPRTYGNAPPTSLFLPKDSDRRCVWSERPESEPAPLHKSLRDDWHQGWNERGLRIVPPRSPSRLALFLC
jgi:hypothetical protein